MLRVIGLRIRGFRDQGCLVLRVSDPGLVKGLGMFQPLNPKPQAMPCLARNGHVKMGRVRGLRLLCDARSPCVEVLS